DEASQALENPLPARQESPSAYAARRERAVLLAEALKKLPADYEEVIVLRHLEGLAFAKNSLVTRPGPIYTALDISTSRNLEGSMPMSSFINRRHFLGAASGLALAQAAAVAVDEAPNQKLLVGVMGTGGRGTGLAAAFQRPAGV